MRTSVSVLALAALLLVLVLPSPARSAGKALVEYNSKKGTITVEAADVAIEDVLSGISQKTGIRIFIDPEVRKNVSVNLKAVPLESALHQIARGLSYALFFESGGGRERLAGIRIVPQGKPGPEPPRRAAPSTSYDMGGRAGGGDIESPAGGYGVQKPLRPHRRKPSTKPSDTIPDDDLEHPSDRAYGINDSDRDPGGAVQSGPKQHRRPVPMGTGTSDTTGSVVGGSDGEPLDDAPEATGESTDTTGPDDTDISASPSDAE